MVIAKPHVNSDSLAEEILNRIPGARFTMALNNLDCQVVVLLQANTFPVLDTRVTQIEDLAGVFRVIRYYGRPKTAKKGGPRGKSK